MDFFWRERHRNFNDGFTAGLPILHGGFASCCHHALTAWYARRNSDHTNVAVKLNGQMATINMIKRTYFGETTAGTEAFFCFTGHDH